MYEIRTYTVLFQEREQGANALNGTLQVRLQRQHRQGHALPCAVFRSRFRTAKSHAPLPLRDAQIRAENFRQSWQSADEHDERSLRTWKILETQQHLLRLCRPAQRKTLSKTTEKNLLTRAHLLLECLQDIVLERQSIIRRTKRTQREQMQPHRLKPPAHIRESGALGKEEERRPCPILQISLDGCQIQLHGAPPCSFIAQNLHADRHIVHDESLQIRLERRIIHTVNLGKHFG